jgi:hypothetical protein
MDPEIWTTPQHEGAADLLRQFVARIREIDARSQALN